MAVSQDAWSSHIWTDQTLMRLIGSSQQQVEIRTNDRMPQSFMVPQSLLEHYCSKLQPSPNGQSFVLETSRAVLALLFAWLYTGKIDCSDWHDLTEVYFLGNAVGSVALQRSAITQLQKACRSDQSNSTELFHYGHISVIEEMVGASSPLSRYVEDTYFNHWAPEDDDGVNDDPSNYPKSSSFFKRLFQRSFKEQKEADNCSCCHDYCKYHDHQNEAERLATCGGSPSLVANSSASLTFDVSGDLVKPGAMVRKARKSKATVRTSLDNVFLTGIDDDSSHKARTSRSGTPKVRAAGDTWLAVQSRAPTNYPAEYHGLLTSLPQVQSIKPSNWLEIGVEAEGVDQLPEPDRIIASAMSWNAEDYAQTQCTFFDQYDATITSRHHWLKPLKFGGSKSKEKAERLLAMWESLGWLKSSETATNDNVQHPDPLASTSEPRAVANSTTIRPRFSFGSKWSQKEKDAVAKIMGSIDSDNSCARLNHIQRARICSKRLESVYVYHRTDKAIEFQWYKAQQELAGAATVQAKNQATPDDPSVSEEEDFVEDQGNRSNSWSSQEEEAMLEIMNALERDPAHRNTTAKQRAEMCKLRLEARFKTDRTPVAINIRYHILRRKRKANQGDNTDASNNFAIDSAMPIILKTPPTTARDSRTQSAVHNVSSNLSKLRWTEQEDKVMAELFKEIEEDPDLVSLNERERSKVCSAHLSSRHKIARTAESVKNRWQRLSQKRKSADTDDYSDHEPLMGHKKRRQGKSRFVAELFDAGED